MEDQYEYTGNPVARKHMYDTEERQQKADKIVAVLEDYFADCRDLSLLDIACSTGIMSSVFADHFGKVAAIDIDEEAVTHANSHYGDRSIEFHTMDALKTSFPDNTFDVVVCNQMYEHVPDAEQLMAEILRVLRLGGICYFGATNRLKIIETHYGRIPFLSYLPKPLAHIYLRILRRGKHYYETLRTYWGLKRLVVAFECIDYTIMVVRDPERFHATDVVNSGSWRQWFSLGILRYAYCLSPGYIWLLKKPTADGEGVRAGPESRQLP